MQKVKEYIDKANNKSLMDNYVEALKSNKFKRIVDLIPLKDQILAKYTSKIEDSSIEFDNCLKCKGLASCKNEMAGYCYFPSVVDNNLSFAYKPCKYMEVNLDNNKYKDYVNLYDVPSMLANAKMKDIYVDDKSRIDVVKYIDNYIKSYNEKREKGLYLYGNFGTGKTYIIAALFNEFAKKEMKSAIIYFPEFLRTLKSTFSSVEEGSFSSKFDYIKKIPLLLIDDIGAENVTAWGRDEILGTILQYRMEENLATFFTSNMSLSELELHLSTTGNKAESLKARRIIERIKYLTNEMKVIGVDRRK